MSKKDVLAMLIKQQQSIVDIAKNEKRELTDAEHKNFQELQDSIDALKRDLENEEAQTQAEPETSDLDAEAVRQAERQRTNEIMNMCRSFGMDADKYINSDMSLDQVRAAVMGEMMANKKPVSVTLQKDEQDKFREAAVDGLQIKAGFDVVGKSAAGAREFAGMSLRDLGIECLSREGHSESELRRMDKTELFEALSRQYYNPSSAFPVIMDQAIKKSIVTMYDRVPTTFEQITSTGVLTDFKQTADHNYVMSSLSDFEYVPEGGELKADMPTFDMLPQRKLKTYGKQFSMTREAFINDDIGFLTTLPGAYTQAAKRTINKQVYQILLGNGKIYDGKDFFCADHKNLMKTGSAPTAAVIQQMILQYKKQTDHFGEPIIISPKKLVVPVGYEFTLAQIFHSATINTPDNTQAVNVLFNRGMEIVEDPTINVMAGDKACPWFMMTDPSAVKGIQVDYLNGNKYPTIRRMEQAGTLGFTWDIYLDWGISVMDYRGFLMNPGVKVE